MLSTNKPINFTNFSFESKPKKQFPLKKIILFFTIFFLGIILSIFFLFSKIVMLSNTSNEYLNIKHFINEEKKAFLQHKTRLIKKEENLSKKLLKLRLLKKSPKKLLELISSIFPEQARLEEFNFNSKESLILKGRTKSYTALQELIQNFENNIYMPPSRLTSSTYNTKDNEFEFTISLRL